MKPEDIPQFVRDIYAKVTDKGPGGHILTGPVFVEGAQPGVVVEVFQRGYRMGENVVRPARVVVAG